MAFTYCTSCGYKNHHGVKLPKFCGGCGKPMNGSEVNKVEAPKIRTASDLRAKNRPRVRADMEEEGSEIDFVPDVSNFKYNISDGGLGGRKMNLKDLTGEISEGDLDAVQAQERGSPAKRKRGRPKGSKNLTNGERRNRKK